MLAQNRFAACGRLGVYGRAWHCGGVPQLDLADDTFVVADPGRVADVVADPAQWARWWPELELTVFQDRGEKGIRWTATGALVGSCENLGGAVG